MLKRFLNIFIIAWMLCWWWNSSSAFSHLLKSQLQEMLRKQHDFRQLPVVSAHNEKQ